MAKKQSADAPDKAAATPPGDQQPKASAGDGKKKEARPKGGKPNPGPPATPRAEAAAPAPAAPATPSAAEPTKKKGRQPGKPPRRGKKLRNQLKNQLQKVPREPVPLKKALGLL